MQDLLQQGFWENTVGDYLLALAVAVGGSILVLVFFRRIFSGPFRKWAESTRLKSDDAFVRELETSFCRLLCLCAVFIGIRTLTLGGAFSRTLNIAALLLFTWFGIKVLSAFIGFGLDLYISKKRPESEAGAKALMPIVKVLLWGLGVFFIMDNMGFEVKTLLAGLGIGGVAVALASQAVLGDLFSYVAIIVDRPFELGDFIIVGDFMGSVEHVGIKTTRLRSLGGEQLVFSNSDLTGSRVRNYKRMERRRVLFGFGVTYSTGAEDLERIPGLVKSIIEEREKTVFDRAHFKGFGDSSLDFEAVYYVLSSDYNEYMDTQQEINLALKRGVESMGVEFAFPSRTIYMSEPAKA